MLAGHGRQPTEHRAGPRSLLSAHRKG
ncbi:hypothetical protein FRIGORI9N_350034 [Frigoribacterium sp. 9N]|nr:hypothetical protein FRIGORI9N_350034 [Frigoribacterium sp. 9N]